jgi:hypothetical protein
MGLPSPTPGSLRLSACKPDHFGPFLGFIRDKLSNAADVIDIGSAPKSASRAFQLGIGKGHMPRAVALAANAFQLEMLASRWHNAATEKWTSARPYWQLETRLHQSRDSTKGA